MLYASQLIDSKLQVQSYASAHTDHDGYTHVAAWASERDLYGRQNQVRCLLHLQVLLQQNQRPARYYCRCSLVIYVMQLVKLVSDCHEQLCL